MTEISGSDKLAEAVTLLYAWKRSVLNHMGSSFLLLSSSDTLLQHREDPYHSEVGPSFPDRRVLRRIHNHGKEGTGNVDPEVIEHRTRPSFSTIADHHYYKSDLGHRKGICFRFPPGPLEAKVGLPETSAGMLLRAQMSPRAVPARSPTWSATRPAQVLSLVL